MDYTNFKILSFISFTMGMISRYVADTIIYNIPPKNISYNYYTNINLDYIIK